MSRGPVRVLVADDDLVSRMAVEDLLRGVPGAAVTLAEDGASAWQALKACGPFDLVCLDVRMPAPDGLEVAERLRHTPALKRLPVMLITSSAERNTVLSASRLQLQGFIVKPVTAATTERLVKALDQLDESVLEPPARTLARLRIDAERHGRYVAAFVQQVRALADLAVEVDAEGTLPSRRAEFVARADAARTGARTLGAPLVEEMLGDAVAAATAGQPGSAGVLAQAAYWLQRVVGARMDTLS